jgi:histidinol-phosphatase (PHP family)
VSPAPIRRIGDRDRRPELALAGTFDSPLDAHLHTLLSPDSKVPLDVYPALAIALGMPRIALTDHLDFDPREVGATLAPHQQRVETVEALRREFGDRLEILLGVEISYERQYEAEIREHLRTNQYDLTIGSVHPGIDSPFKRSLAANWAGHDVHDTAPYFAEVQAGIESGLFDIVGHMDYVRKYVYPFIDTPAFEAAPDLYEPVLKALIETGTALEINTSGWRQRTGVPYPLPQAVRRYRELGGEYIVTGSDAHQPDWFAMNFDRARELLLDAGFEELATKRWKSAGEQWPIPTR